MAGVGAGGSVAETIITAMTLDASGYRAGVDEVVKQDGRLIASFNRVTEAYKKMRDAVSQGIPFAGFTFGGGGGGSVAGAARSYGGPTSIIPVPTSSGGLLSSVPGGGPQAWYTGGGGFPPGQAPWGGPIGSTPPPNWRAGPPPVVTGGGGNTPDGGSNGGGGGFSLGSVYLALGAIRGLEQALEALAKIAIRVSVESLHEYAAFDTLQKSFIGLYGSTTLANQAVTYLRDTAMTSAFHFRDLADAMRGLAVAGLDVNRFLPIVQGFALAMGHVDASGLEDFISILRRLQGGNTGLALGPRGIGRYGVSRQELENYGATFQHGHFTGSINQAFDAIEGVFNARIKGIADSVQKSFEVTLSNAKDAVQQASIDFGKGLADGLIGPIQDATSALNGLRKAGVLEYLGQTLAGIVTGGLDTGKPAPFSFSRRDNESDEEANKRYSKEAHAYIKRRFDVGLDDNGRLGPRSGGDVVTDTLISIGGGIVQMVTYMEQFVQGAKATYDVLAAIWDFLGGANLIKLWNPTMVNAGAEFERNARARLYQQAHDNLMNPDGSPKAPATPEPAGQDDDFIEANQHLEHIARNTGRIADHFDSRSTAFGGGDIGKYGVTPVEMGTYYHQTGGISHSFAAFGNKLQQDVQRMIHEAYMNGARQGMWQARGS